MGQNPLQKYFRQPKLFVQLPSAGVYYAADLIQGDISKLAVFGMTGMDEILIRTPDALLTGESTVRIIQSCCPSIQDPWQLCNLDIEPLLTAIRIATFGERMTLSRKCSACGSEHDYEVDLTRAIDYFKTLRYDNRIVTKELVITLKPMIYKDSNSYGLKNFQLQQQIKQLMSVEDPEQRQKFLSNLYVEIADLQKQIFSSSIESVETNDCKVSEFAYIKEWLENCDKQIYDLINEKINENNDRWSMPPVPIKCSDCGHEQQMSLNMDYADFFGLA